MIDPLASILLIVLQPLTYGWLSQRRYQRHYTFFGVRVSPEFARSDQAQAVWKRFHARIWLCTLIVSLAYTILLGFSAFARNDVSTYVFAAVLVVNMMGCTILFGIASRTIRREAPQLAAPIRTAPLFPQQAFGHRWLAAVEWSCMLIPMAVPVGTGLYVLATRPSPPHYLFTIIEAFVLALLPATTQFGLTFRARSADWSADPQLSRKYRATIGAMQSSVFTLMIFQFCALPFMDMDSYFRFSFPAQLLLLGAVLCMRSWLGKHFDPQASDAMSDNCWKWGYFYSNPDDPALIVPLRSGLGFSFNLAQPSIRVIGGLIAVTMVAILF